MVGECGHRGYFEFVGFDPEVAAQIYKFVSISLCARHWSVPVEMQVNPPVEGDPSYPLYKQEYDSIFQGLQNRATALFEAFKQMEGVQCQDPQVCSSFVHLSLLPICLLTSSTGLNVSLPNNHHPQQAIEQAKTESATQTNSTLPDSSTLRASVLSLAPLRPEGGHVAFQNDVLGSGHGVGGEDCGFHKVYG
jgi:hypothetical protein